MHTHVRVQYTCLQLPSIINKISDVGTNEQARELLVGINNLRPTLTHGAAYGSERHGITRSVAALHPDTLCGWCVLL